MAQPRRIFVRDAVLRAVPRKKKGAPVSEIQAKAWSGLHRETPRPEWWSSQVRSTLGMLRQDGRVVRVSRGHYRRA